jgi:hypothetical protein
LRVSYVAELGARACVRAPRVVLAVVVCGTVLAPRAPIASGAGAPSDRVAPVAESCSNETVNPGFGQPITLRFVLHGVSCDTGHRLIQTYFHDIAAKTCRGRGTTCIFEYPGDWDCSSPPPSFPISPSHRFAVCQTLGGRPAASVTVYRATRHTKKPARTTEFVARLRVATIECGLASAKQIVCQAVPRTSGATQPLAQVATLRRDGRLTKCTEHLTNPRCGSGNFGDPIPSFLPGKHVVVGAFECQVFKTSVECSVAATGKGFRISRNAVRSVGG